MSNENNVIELDPFAIIRQDVPAHEPKEGEPVRESVPGKIPNGVFTFIGGRGHRTLKIKTVLEGPLKGKRILYVMTGPDNVHDYTGVAFVNDDDTIKVWKRMSGTEYVKVAKAFRAMILDEPTTNGKTLAEIGYRLETAKNCIACNRLLTNPESIELGIGPECGGRS